jgi:septum formation protein
MTTSPLLLLASASPRRSALLTQIGVAHEIVPTTVDESVRPGEPPEALVLRLARAKAVAGAVGGRPALGADTVVALGEHLFGKPRDAADAAAILGALSGRAHRVCSGVALAHGGRVATRLSETVVHFRALTRAEIDDYSASGEPQDKAGAYAVQGRAAVFIARIEGSYSGVMGLPVFETAELLAEAGLLPAAGAPR